MKRRALVLGVLLAVSACGSRPEIAAVPAPIGPLTAVKPSPLPPNNRERLRTLLSGRHELHQALVEALSRDLADWLAVEEARWAEAPVKIDVFPRLGLVQASQAGYDFTIAGAPRLVEQDDPAYPYRAVVPVSWLGQVRYGTATMPPVQGAAAQANMVADRVPLFRPVSPPTSMPEDVVRIAGAACAAAIPQAERGTGEAVLVLRAEDAKWVVLP